MSDDTRQLTAEPAAAVRVAERRPRHAAPANGANGSHEETVTIAVPNGRVGRHSTEYHEARVALAAPASATINGAPVINGTPVRRPRPGPKVALLAAEPAAAVAGPSVSLTKAVASLPEPVRAPSGAAARRPAWLAHRWTRSGLRVALVLVIAVTAAVALRTWVVSPYYIPSESMEPTLHGCTGCNNDHVLVDKLSYHLHSVHRTDIVVFHRPPAFVAPEDVLIKRVIGLPGDVVVVKNGHVYINGKELAEPYVKQTDQCKPQTTQPLTPTSTWTVPKGDVFVMGDNRCDSQDSRVFGPIKESSIIGRAFMIIYPIGRITFL